MTTPDEAATGPSPSMAELAEAVNSTRLATLGMLLAGVAHELNTPLGALASNHDVVKRSLARLQDILADEVVDESELGEVRRIVRALDAVLKVNDLAVERIVSLVQSLRTFGSPDRARVDTVDLREGIESALTLLRHRMGDGIRVEREYGELPPIRCYPHQLNQAFMNLLLNAVQAMDGEGVIRIGARREADEVVVEIQDTGPGMSEAVLARVFEPGFTTKDSRVGMGLGLLIVHRVVDLHGGSVTAESTPGEGATFILRLPQEPRSADDRTRDAGPTAQRESSGPGSHP